MAHAGSWFGLPDFGVTEAIGGLLNKSRTTQGGSNLIGPAPKAQVQGANTVVPASAPNPSLRQNSGYFAGGYSGGGAAPASSGGAQPPMQETPQQPSIDFDALIRPAIEGLEAAIGPLQQSTEADIQGIESNRVSQTAKTNQSIGAQTSTIGQAKDTQRGYERSAADEARRQYSEVQQGLFSRYGGTTGTGAFATELAGGQTIRSIAGIREAAAKSIANLDDKLVQVQEIGRIALQDIDNQAKDQTAKAKANLELALADIRNQKGQLLARKAELAANAIQMYQQTVNQVNANNTAFKQQLYLQQQQAQQQLEAARGKAQSITQAATPEDLSGLVQSLQPLINAGFTPTYSTKYGGGSLSFTPKKKESNSINSINSILEKHGLGDEE